MLFCATESAIDDVKKISDVTKKFPSEKINVDDLKKSRRLFFIYTLRKILRHLRFFCKLDKLSEIKIF